MKVSCPSCQTHYNIDDKRIPPGGAKLKCAKCQTSFPLRATVARDEAGAAIPLPSPGAAPASHGAIPLPGPSSSTPPSGGWGGAPDEAVSLPGASDAGGGAPADQPGAEAPSGWGDPPAEDAVPLPGSADGSWGQPEAPAEQQAWGETPAEEAVPLPGQAAESGWGEAPLDEAIPSQGEGNDAPVDEAPGPGGVSGDWGDAPAEEAVPLPGQRNGGWGEPAAPSEQTAWGEAPDDEAVPLPGHAEGGWAEASAEPNEAALDSSWNQVGTDSGGWADAGEQAAPAPSADGGWGDEPASDQAPLASDAVPLPDPGQGGWDAPTDDEWADADEQAASDRAPLASDAVPLSDPGQGEWDAPTDVAAIPLPGSGPEPLGEASSPTDEWRTPEAAIRPAVPLGGEEPNWDEQKTRLTTIPLPGAAFPDAPPTDGAAFGLDDLPAPAQPSAPASDELSFDEPPAAAPAAPSFELDDLPQPAAAPSFELDDLPAPASAPSFELDDLPAPASAPSFELDDLPAPAAPASAELPDFSLDVPASEPESFELDDLPAPKAEAGHAGRPLQPAARAAPVDVGADFGDVDFGNADASDGGADDLLSFDPGPAEGSLSGPSSNERLETLNFVDDAGQGGDRPDRFHIRRRSGKVFGPFDEAVVVKMLEDGQLLGNEDISTDSEVWSAIGTHGSFGAAISRLTEAPQEEAPAPVDGGPAPATEGEAAAPAPSASMEKLKTAYESRMAAVSVADPGRRFRLPARLPVLIGGVAAVLALATGLAFGTTRYGVFGLKLFFPARVSADTPEFAALAAAREGLLSDTFGAYRKARDSASTALNVKEYPEARALWAQATFYLYRRYAAATPADLATAREALPHVELLGKKHPEVVKAQAGDALSRREAAEALALLEDAAARADNSADLEISFLRAEAYAMKGQGKLALELLQRVRKQAQGKAGAAKALHAIGDLHQANKEAELAAQSYEEALQVDPDHVASALELAALELTVRKDPAKGASAIDRALDEKRRKLLGPAELARAEALKGAALAMQGKPADAAVALESALKLDPSSSYAKANLAQVLRTQGDYEKALPLFKDAAAREPNNLEYVEGYLASLVKTGKMVDALAQVEVANQRFPGNARIAFLSGQVNEALGKPKDAETSFLRAAGGDPTGADAHLALARLYVAQRRVPEAKQQLAAAAEKAPNSAAVHTGKGELALDESDLDTAAKAFALAVEKEPVYAAAHVGLSRVALLRGDLALASTEIEKAVEAEPHGKGVRLQRGVVFFRQEKLDEALTELETARSDEPKAAQPAIVQAAVKLAKKDFAGAETSALAAIQLEPKHPEAHFQMARAKSRRNEHSGAIESMKRGLDLAPKRPEFHYEMGVVFRSAGKIAEAVEAWKAALALAPTYADPLEALGQAAYDRGDYDGASGYFDSALKADPSRSRVVALLADCAFQTGKWNEAIARYQKALSADPSLGQVPYKIGRAYSEKGQLKEAVNWYRKATEVEPESPMPHYYLGYAFKELGKKRDAVAAFKTYLQKKPDADDKKEIEDEIYDLEQ